MLKEAGKNHTLIGEVSSVTLGYTSDQNKKTIKVLLLF